MKRRIIGAIAILAVLGLVGTSAYAHKDYSADGDNDSTTRCDTWYREGHAKDAAGRPDKKPNGEPNPEFDSKTGHSEDHESEFDQGQTGPAYIHNHTGHYVVRHDAFYVEVVGGGGYGRNGNQGGYVQGEIDPGSGAPDADLHANTFAGSNDAGHSEAVCASAANNKVGDEGEQP